MTKELQLVDILKNQALTTSLLVADYFGKRHDNVIKAIETAKSSLLKIEDAEDKLSHQFRDSSQK